MKDKIKKALDIAINASKKGEDITINYNGNFLDDMYNLITEKEQYIAALERDIEAFKSKGLTASAVQETIAENERLQESLNEAYAQGYEQAKIDILELIKIGI